MSHSARRAEQLWEILTGISHTRAEECILVSPLSIAGTQRLKKLWQECFPNGNLRVVRTLTPEEIAQASESTQIIRVNPLTKESATAYIAARSETLGLNEFNASECFELTRGWLEVIELVLTHQAAGVQSSSNFSPLFKTTCSELSEYERLILILNLLTGWMPSEKTLNTFSTATLKPLLGTPKTPSVFQGLSKADLKALLDEVLSHGQGKLAEILESLLVEANHEALISIYENLDETHRETASIKAPVYQAALQFLPFSSLIRLFPSVENNPEFASERKFGEAILLRNSGKLDEAKELLDELVKTISKTVPLYAKAVRQLAVQYYQEANWEKAKKLYQEAIKYTPENQKSSLLYDLAICEDQLEQPEKCTRLLSEAMECAKRSNQPQVLISIHHFSSNLALNEGSIDSAKNSLNEASLLMQKGGTRSQQIYQPIYEGELALRVGDFCEARKHYARSLTLGEKLGSQQFAFRAWLGTAIASFAEGNELLFNQAYEHFFSQNKVQSRFAWATDLLELMNAFLKGERNEVRSLAEKAKNKWPERFWITWTLSYLKSLEWISYKANSEQKLAQCWDQIFTVHQHILNRKFPEAYSLALPLVEVTKSLNSSLLSRVLFYKAICKMKENQNQGIELLHQVKIPADTLIASIHYALTDELHPECAAILSDGQSSSVQTFLNSLSVSTPDVKMYWDGKKLARSTKNTAQWTFHLSQKSILSPEREELDFSNKPLLFRLTQFFALRPNELISKEELVTKVWLERYQPMIHDNSVYNSVHRLKKLFSELSSELGQAMRCESQHYSFKPSFTYQIVSDSSDLPTQNQLNPRQIEILRYLKYHESIDRSTYVKNNQVSPRTAVRDFDELVQHNMLKRLGKGRGVKYSFHPNFQRSGVVL